MKPRRVIITLEVETDAPISELREKGKFNIYHIQFGIRIMQVQANVIKKK